MTRRTIAVRGMTFNIREVGSGEPVLLLHGFPETSASWKNLMPRLPDSGYRCVAPDQRGYSPEARPEGIAAYAADLIVEDAFAIADACGFPARFHLVAHDWGAGIGWRMVQRQPERIATWTEHRRNKPPFCIADRIGIGHQRARTVNANMAQARHCGND